jgi:pimeloyl-ACP methyl ester carboxylesterase
MGESTRKPDRTEQTDAEDMREVLDALGLDRVPVLAHCGGSGSALALAARWPERVQFLTLVSPAAPLYGPGADGYLNAALSRMRETLRSRLGSRIMAWAQRRHFLRDPEKFLDRNWQLLPAADRQWVTGQRRGLTRAEVEEYLSHRDVFLGEWRSVLGPWSIDWRAIKCPVFIDHGELDATWPVGCGRWLASVIPGAKLRVDPARGHFFNPAGLPALLAEGFAASNPEHR